MRKPIVSKKPAAKLATVSKPALATAKAVSAAPASKPVKPAPKATSAKLGVAAAKQAASGKSNVAKPATGKPATADKPTRVSSETRIARDDTNVLAAARYPGGTVSAADELYIGFFASAAKAARGGVVLFADIANKRPSGVSIDNNGARAIRLTKAGIIKPLADHSGFTFTELGKRHKLYASAR